MRWSRRSPGSAWRTPVTGDPRARRPRALRAGRGAAAALAVALAASPAAARACSVEIVLAMDVSRSVSAAEYALQIDGLAAALRDETVGEVIAWLPGGVMAAVTQWGSGNQQSVSVGWTALRAPGDLAAMADQVEATPRAYYQARTAIGEAIAHADALFDANPAPCTRRVIDISGDGVFNAGREPGPLADAAVARGAVINGLVIRGAQPDPLLYYMDHVRRGPGAFVEVAESHADYPRAILRKLLRELSLTVSELE